ncbi:hypothetical protein TNCV_4520221 [Trichonephila clavipes]|nr:hypothetical protein TNCV_4520221 [Trichonephila clavipes]
MPLDRRFQIEVFKIHPSYKEREYVCRFGCSIQHHAVVSTISKPSQQINVRTFRVLIDEPCTAERGPGHEPMTRQKQHWSIARLPWRH